VYDTLLASPAIIPFNVILALLVLSYTLSKPVPLASFLVIEPALIEPKL